MTKSELIEQLTTENDVLNKREAELIVNSIFDSICPSQIRAIPSTCPSLFFLDSPIASNISFFAVFRSGFWGFLGRFKRLKNL